MYFDKPVNIQDSINQLTGAYNNRQIDIDLFNSYTTELRVLQHYRLGRYAGTLVTGVQYMNNDLHRRQIGKGTNGSDFDLTLVDPVWGEIFTSKQIISLCLPRINGSYRNRWN